MSSELAEIESSVHELAVGWVWDQSGAKPNDRDLKYALDNFVWNENYIVFRADHWLRVPRIPFGTRYGEGEQGKLLKIYVDEQRQHFKDQKIVHDNYVSESSELCSIMMQLFDTKERVPVMNHERQFVIPVEFLGFTDRGMIRLGGIVPPEKLSIQHKGAANMLKAHSIQTVHFIQNADPFAFYSFPTITKFAAHRATTPGWRSPHHTIKISNKRHPAFTDGAKMPDLMDAIAKYMLADVTGDYSHDMYKSVIRSVMRRKPAERPSLEDLKTSYHDSHFDEFEACHLIDYEKLEALEHQAWKKHMARTIASTPQEEKALFESARDSIALAGFLSGSRIPMADDVVYSSSADFSMKNAMPPPVPTLSDFFVNAKKAKAKKGKKH